MEALCELLVLLASFALAFAGELTFELPDNEKQCFHEVIDKDVKCTLEFQVVNVSMNSWSSQETL